MLCELPQVQGNFGSCGSDVAPRLVPLERRAADHPRGHVLRQSVDPREVADARQAQPQRALEAVEPSEQHRDVAEDARLRDAAHQKDHHRHQALGVGRGDGVAVAHGGDGREGVVGGGAVVVFVEMRRGAGAASVGCACDCPAVLVQLQGARGARASHLYCVKKVP